MRQARFFCERIDIATLCQPHRVQERICHLREELAHLLAIPQKILSAIEVKMFSRQLAARLNAEQCFMGLRICCIDVVQIVCGKQGNAEIPVHLIEILIDLWLRGRTMLVNTVVFLYL